ncbi:P-loop containing nucleoside triphosphate hydrolase protein [Russula dissimulans]|nr:P-loop containing nucleoside triphosphate hydrolase protein [Russula dissimulans]
MSLRLPAGFDFYLGARFALRFRHNRITLRRQYHALIASFSPSRRLLFPSVSDMKPMRTLPRAEISDLKSRHLVNRNIRDDDQQLQAVVSILEQSQGSVPFIVYGPPGTGKTSVVVESIVQLVRRDAGVRVLACTPSEVGTDFLAERLVAAGLESDKLFHLNVPSRCEDISDDPRILSLMPGYERLLAFRVVVSTCSSANVLHTLNVPRGHFSHVVIDEAAQAEEPLAMIPIMTFANAHTKVILAGDPNQFGPAIRSPIASSAGLRMSYLERLMLMHEVYGPDTQAGGTIVELLRNRRSHPSIIAWSNRYFYEDRMREYANTYITYDLVHSNVLPKKGLPVVFHGVRGSEEHTKWSPSSFNILEASIIRDYCVKLTADPERKIYPEEIRVLALYKAQVRAIRELLRAAELSDIAVGSIEQFQGQERKVIILATTRNEESHPRKGLGFVVNRQYMNVAITRAQALLIVIGDPEVLGKDELWRTFLEYINSREGWTGKVHKWDAAESDSVPGYVVESRKGSVLYGEEFMDRKSEKIYRSSGSNGG